MFLQGLSFLWPSFILFLFVVFFSIFWHRNLPTDLSDYLAKEVEFMFSKRISFSRKLTYRLSVENETLAIDSGLPKPWNDLDLVFDLINRVDKIKHIKLLFHHAWISANLLTNLLVWVELRIRLTMLPLKCWHVCLAISGELCFVTISDVWS